MNHLTDPNVRMVEDKVTDPKRWTGPIALSVIAYAFCAWTALSTGDLFHGTALLFMIALYWLPSYVAVWRGHKGIVGTVMVNLFFGWTIIGWIIAMAMALRHHRAYPVSV